MSRDHARGPRRRSDARPVRREDERVDPEPRVDEALLGCRACERWTGTLAEAQRAAPASKGHHSPLVDPADDPRCPRCGSIDLDRWRS